MSTIETIQKNRQAYLDAQAPILAAKKAEEEKQQELATGTFTKIGMLDELIKAANLNIDIKEAHNEQYFIVQTISEKLRISSKYEELESKYIKLQTDMQYFQNEQANFNNRFTEQNTELNQCIKKLIELNGCCEDLTSTSCNL